MAQPKAGRRIVVGVEGSPVAGLRRHRRQHRPLPAAQGPLQPPARRVTTVSPCTCSTPTPAPSDPPPPPAPPPARSAGPATAPSPARHHRFALYLFDAYSGTVSPAAAATYARE